MRSTASLRGVAAEDQARGAARVRVLPPQGVDPVVAELPRLAAPADPPVGDLAAAVVVAGLAHAGPRHRDYRLPLAKGAKRGHEVRAKRSLYPGRQTAED